MVKGITRQVVVVNGTNEASFDQAIFLVKNNVITKGGITEDALLKEARQLCSSVTHRGRCILWSLSGSALTGLIWLITALFQ